MKRMLLLTSAMLIIATITKAQISRGTLFLGGNLNVNTNKNDDLNQQANSSQLQTYFTVSPLLGFTIKDNLVLGFSLTYGHGTTNNSSNGAAYNYPGNTFGAGLFERKYIELGKHFYFFTEANLQFLHTEQSYVNDQPSNTTTEIKNSYLTAGIYPGVSYAVSRHFYLEAGINNLFSLGSAWGTSETTANGVLQQRSKSTRFSASTNLSSAVPVTVGFRFAFPK